MKSIYFLLFILSTFSTFAQIKTTENRIEIELKDGYTNEEVYSFGDQGFILTSNAEKQVDGQVELHFQHYSTDLSFVDEQIYELRRGFHEVRNYVTNEDLYRLYMDRMGKFILLQYHIKTGMITSLDGDFEHSYLVNAIEIAENHLMLIGSYKRKLEIINLEISNGNIQRSPIVIEGVHPKRMFFNNLQYLEQTHAFYTSIRGFPSKKISNLYIQQYDIYGNLTHSSVLYQDLNRKFMNSSAAPLNEEELLITGTYSNGSGSASAGLYMATTKDGAVNETNYYNFIDLENFLSYLPQKSQDRIVKKKERYAEKGKELSYSYLMAVHDIIPCDEDFLFLGEAYYPTYRTESRTTYVNGKPTTTYYQVFDGYQYTHALLAKFDKEGKLIWSQCFKMYPKYKPYYVKRFIRVAGKSQSGIKLVFADGKYIYGKEFDFDGNVISDKTSSEINGSKDNDQVKNSYSDIVYWYDHFFLSYGFQRIKNTKDEDVKRKRNVLFINKIMFE